MKTARTTSANKSNANRGRAITEHVGARLVGTLTMGTGRKATTLTVIAYAGDNFDAMCQAFDAK